jgi:Xaa-Pro aminopeptidase
MTTPPDDSETLARACAALADTGCDLAVLSSNTHVTYVSGFAVPSAVGFSAVVPYAAPFAVISVRGADTWLAVSVFHTAQAERESRLEHLLTFAGFDNVVVTEPRATYLETLRSALVQASLGRTGRLGVEGRALPYGAAAFIAQQFPNVSMIEIDDALEAVRQVKTDSEIAHLRAAAHIGDVGQQTLADLTQTAGRNEFELYGAVLAGMQQAAGHTLTVEGELVTGPRLPTVGYPGGPRDRITEPGDVALLDISPRVDGYWSDCTNTRIVGGQPPNPHKLKYVQAARAAFEAAVDQLRPGRLATEVWSAANTVFEKYGIPMRHYLGHQVGVTVNEPPRLVPYDHTPLQANMVFAVEPGAYEDAGGTFGVRYEKVVRVTETGPEVLSQFEWGL